MRYLISRIKFMETWKRIESGFKEMEVIASKMGSEVSAVNEDAVDNDYLHSIICNNDYVKNCKSNKYKDRNSLSYLINKPMSQSDCIKLGIGVEKITTDIILHKTNYKNIKQKNMKGKKETDHLFKDEINKVIYYSELKANINLDTEKSRSTYTKCLGIAEDLKKAYPDYEIRWCLLALRYLEYDDIPNVIKKKYEDINGHLFGINQYMASLNIDLTFTHDTYKKYLNDIAERMFN